MKNENCMIEAKLYTVKYDADTVSHLVPDEESCKKCISKACQTVCPANVYEWNDTENRLIVNFENCLECGACKIACEKHTLGWQYPKGTKGVTFKQG